MRQFIKYFCMFFFVLISGCGTFNNVKHDYQIYYQSNQFQETTEKPTAELRGFGPSGTGIKPSDTAPPTKPSIPVKDIDITPCELIQPTPFRSRPKFPATKLRENLSNPKVRDEVVANYVRDLHQHLDALEKSIREKNVEILRKCGKG